jgi:hypothetical protein
MRLEGFILNARERAFAVFKSYGMSGEAVTEFVQQWREVWSKQFARKGAFPSVAQSFNETGPFENINVFVLSRFGLLKPRTGSGWRELGEEVELLSASLVLAIVDRLRYEGSQDPTFKWRLGFELSMAYFNMEAAQAFAVRESTRQRRGRGVDPDLKLLNRLKAHYGNDKDAKTAWVTRTGKTRRALNKKIKKRKEGS